MSPAAQLVEPEHRQGLIHRPLVSVVIPTHNRAQLLERALQSVLAQTYENLEIIVIDDASTDGTTETVQSLSDPRIRYIRQAQNKGGAAARNVGISIANGKYVAFLDDDDEWESEKTRYQLARLRETDVDAVLCMYSMYGKEVVSRQGEPMVTLEELRHGFVRGGSTSALMAKAAVMKEVLFDETLPKCQDWDLCIRLAQKYKLACLDMPLVRYNDGAHERISNRIVRLPIEQLRGELRMLDKHRGFFGSMWYSRHMCRFLLYGIGRRPNKIACLRYLIEQFGFLQVLHVLLERGWRRMRRNNGEVQT